MNVAIHLTLSHAMASAPRATAVVAGAVAGGRDLMGPACSNSRGGPDCLNGGACVPEANYCACPAGTSGDLCEFVNACDLRCKNGGSCRHDDPGLTALLQSGKSRKRPGSTTYCECPRGFRGAECEVPFEKCPAVNLGGVVLETECLHGGQCVFRQEEGGDQFGCACPNGRYGASCEKEKPIHETRCQIDADCHNGGLCVRGHHQEATFESGETMDTLQCLCGTGWGGDDCSLRCETLDCQHGSSCRFRVDANDDAEAGAFCDCPPGFRGRECQHKTQVCPGGKGLECLHGGSCVAAGDRPTDSYRCACPTGRTGERCERTDHDHVYKSSEAISPPAVAKGREGETRLSTAILAVAIVTAVAFLLAVMVVTAYERRRRRACKEWDTDKRVFVSEQSTSEGGLGDTGGSNSPGSGEDTGLI